MIGDKLYRLAAEFYKRKLWRDLVEFEIFGVRLPDGTIAYCSVTGNDGENFALSVYVGDSGFATYRRTHFPWHELSENEYFFRLVERKFLKCIFVAKDDLSDEELTAEKSFSKSNKIYFRGKLSHPRFLKSQPLTLEEPIDSQEDAEILAAALEGAVEFGKFYPDNLPKNISLPSFPPIRKKFPVLTPDGEKFKWIMANLPPYRHDKYLAAEFTQSAVAKLRQAKKVGEFECELFVLSEPLRDREDGIYKFPVIMLMKFYTDKKLDTLPITLTYPTDRKSLTQEFIDSCLKVGVPEKISVRTERTFVFLEELCEAAGIELCEVEDFDDFEVGEQETADEGESEEGETLVDTEKVIRGLVRFIEVTPVDRLKKFFSEDNQNILNDLERTGLLTPEAKSKLQKIL